MATATSEPGLASFTDPKDDGDNYPKDNGGGDNWIHKSCKAPVKSAPTNQHLACYRPDALSVAQPTVSEL